MPAVNLSFLLRDAHEVDFAVPERVLGKFVFQTFERKVHIFEVVFLFHIERIFVAQRQL